MPDFAVRTAFTAVDKVSPAFNRMEKAAKGFGSVVYSVLPVLGVAVLANYASKAIDLASSLTEVQNVVDTTFGASANQINQWSQNAINQFGLSELQAKQFTGSLGAMMKSSGLASDQIVKMSTDLSGLAGDFASFYNLPIEQAFEKIRSGISGETEPLKQLGINMSVANMQAFALAQGMNKQWGAMTQAEQTQLRYAYLMKVSADAQGDFNKTLATSYANQKRVLGVQFDQALATLAKGILPSLTEAFKSLNEGMRAVNWEAVGSVLTVILKVIPYIVAGFLAWKVALYGIATAQAVMNIAGWIKYLWMMKDVIWQAVLRTNAWAVAQKAINFLLSANPIGIVIVAIAALGYAIYDLYKNWDIYSLNFQIGIQEHIFQWKSLKYQVLDFLNTLGLVSEEAKKASLQEAFKSMLDLDQLKVDKFRKQIARGDTPESVKIMSMGKTLEAPNRAATELQAGNTNVNIYSNGTEAKAEVTPRRGATINMNRLGYQQ